MSFPRYPFSRLAIGSLLVDTRVGQLFINTVKAWVAHRAASKGAALAFYALFSMTPILMLVIAVAGYFFGEQAAQGQIIAQIGDQVGTNAAQFIQTLLSASRDSTSGTIASVIAAGVFVIGGTTVFVELKSSLDEIWECGATGETGVNTLVRTRLLAFMLVLVLAILLLISLMANAGFAVLEHYAAGVWMRLAGLFSLLAAVLSYAVIVGLFAVIYKMLPSVAPAWRDVWVGALFTTALFSLGKYAIGIYLSRSGVASSFGAAGSLIALLIWIYYSAQIFFLGAEFTRQYALIFGSLACQETSAKSGLN